MRVQSLQLTHFRNYPSLQVQFSPGKNMILGENGQGKTNLLEAIYFLSHARSHRAGSDRELILQGEAFATVSAVLTNHYYEGRTLAEAQIKIEAERLKTSFKLNGNPLRSRSELLGHLPTVSFFLPDLLLLRGTPDDRRKWLDAAIVQFDKRHLLYLSEFQKIRQHKNQLLKNPLPTISKDHLQAWNTQLAVAGARVISSRLQYLAIIEDLTALSYAELSDSRETFAMRYLSAVWTEMDLTLPPGETWSVLQQQSDGVEARIEASLQALLEARMSDELRRGTCLVGPHRDDIAFTLNGLDADAYASQGQQRCVVLALKLAELKTLHHKLQEPPVLLLDDVMAELDAQRQRLLVSHIHPESQVFLTTTHPSATWSSLLETQDEQLAVFEVTQGQLHSATTKWI